MGRGKTIVRPAIDPLFRSPAAAYGRAVVGVVLTGQLDDGTAGLLAIKDRGGLAIVQDPSEATAPSMPWSALRAVPVDHCCTLADMAALFVKLAKDDPPVPDSKSPPLMEIENRLAAGVFGLDDCRGLEQMARPASLNCPICRSVLYELSDKRVLRFRCRAGHGFSALSLLSGQAEELETLLSTTFGAMIDEITLAKRVITASASNTDASLAPLENRVAYLETEAVKVGDWLHSMTGLVEPEPRLPEIRSPASPVREWVRIG